MKFCKGCANCKITPGVEGYHSEYSCNSGEHSPITGAIIYESCNWARDSESSCGPGAKRFVPRKTLIQKFISLFQTQ